MRAYLARIPLAVWGVIGLPLLFATRCAVMTIVPHVVQAVVPQAVRSVLHVI